MDRGGRAAGGAVWYWLFALLLVMSSVNFWLQRDAWLDNPSVRSLLLRLGWHTPSREKDWWMVPSTVRCRWVFDRATGSTALLVQGRLRNLLAAEVMPPHFRVDFYAADGSESLAVRDYPFHTLASDLFESNQIPKLVADALPFRASGERAFAFLIRSVPAAARTFVLYVDVGRDPK